MPYAQSGDVAIYYETHGQGPAVVFVHGGGGNTLSWFQQVPQFSRSYRVITVDLRGFKHSKCPPQDAHPRYYVQDMLAVLDAEGIERASFVCQSLGAWAGLPLAVRHPERVAALVLTGSPTPAYSEQNWALLRKSGDRFNSSREEGVAVQFLAPVFTRGQPALHFLYDQIRLLNGPFDARTMQGEEVRLHPADFAGYRTPTLMMGGEQDHFLEPDSHHHVVTLIPGAQLYSFPESGHSAYFEEPEHFNEVVGQFLSRHAPG